MTANRLLANNWDENKTYEPLSILEELYTRISPKYGFTATDRKTAEAWARKFRPALHKLLGLKTIDKFFGIDKVTAELVQSDDCGDYSRNIFWYQLARDTISLPIT